MGCPLQARRFRPNCAGRSRSLSIDASRLRGAMKSANLRGQEAEAGGARRSQRPPANQSSCTGEFRVESRTRAPKLVCRSWAVSAPLSQIPLARIARCERSEPRLPSADERELGSLKGRARCSARSRPYEPRLEGRAYEPRSEARPYRPRLEERPDKPQLEAGPYEPQFAARPYEPRLAARPYEPQLKERPCKPGRMPGAEPPQPYRPQGSGHAQNETFRVMAPKEMERDWPPNGPWVRFLVWWETWLAPRLGLRS